MACCKVCCGCQDCIEGQQGKCCCGGSSGECCQAGEYCCSGVCQATPCCSGACDEENPCPEGCACVDGQCVPGVGACCTCSYSELFGSSLLWPPGTPAGAGFCTHAERQAHAAAIRDHVQPFLDNAAAVLEANGWTCPNTDITIFLDSGTTDDPTDRWWNEDCLGQEVFWASLEAYSVLVNCCGTVDTAAEPLDIGISTDGEPVYPCVGPYVYGICTDNVSAEDCQCGTYHAGKTCAEEPCSDCAAEECGWVWYDADAEWSQLLGCASESCGCPPAPEPYTGGALEIPDDSPEASDPPFDTIYVITYGGVPTDPVIRHQCTAAENPLP